MAEDTLAVFERLRCRWRAGKQRVGAVNQCLVLPLFSAALRGWGEGVWGVHVARQWRDKKMFWPL